MFPVLYPDIGNADRINYFLSSFTHSYIPQLQPKFLEEHKEKHTLVSMWETAQESYCLAEAYEYLRASGIWSDSMMYRDKLPSNCIFCFSLGAALQQAFSNLASSIKTSKLLSLCKKTWNVSFLQEPNFLFTRTQFHNRVYPTKDSHWIWLNHLFWLWKRTTGICSKSMFSGGKMVNQHR